MESTEKKIKSFLKGEITDRNELRKLFDDFDFTTKLIRYTRDLSYYDRCSLRLKMDIDFALFFTDYFDDDLNTLFKMINNCYYSHGFSSLDQKYVLLLSRIDGYIRTREFEFDVVYQMQYRQKIIELLENIHALINRSMKTISKDERVKNKFGFCFVMNNFDNDEIRIFFARYFINKIFYKYDFEEKMHKKYDDVTSLLNDGQDKVILDYINSFDESLGYYVEGNESLMHEIYRALNMVVDDYSTVSLSSKEKVRLFNEKLVKYVEEESIDIPIDFIKMQEVVRLGLDKEFLGFDLGMDLRLPDKSVVSFQEEKVRLFIRTELQNLFKNKARKLELNKDK